MLSLAVHNARVVACAVVRGAHRDGWLPQAKFRLDTVSAATGALVTRPGQKPPPEPPPALS